MIDTARTLLALLTLAPLAGFAQSPQPATPRGSRDLDREGMSIQAPAPDRSIERALGQISPRQIEHTITTLVAFGTRNTLSSMASDLPRGQGVSAAADWIAAELERYSAACGGCLEVKRDTFTESPQNRIPVPTRITNVYAILHGADAAQSARRVLVTGHYDSRNSDTLDSHGAAPGANDDASGVAVSLECARVLSQLRLPATLVFAAVAGEEQGLNGSRHLARLARAQNWQLEAVLNNDIVGGNTTPGDERQDKSAVRIFSEGIPAVATPEQLQLIESAGYESDSPSRELARAVLEVSLSYQALALPHVTPAAQGFRPVLIFRRDRFLRGGDHSSFNQEGFPAVRFTEWREDFDHQHQNVRREHGVQYGDLPQFVDFQYVARVAALNAAALASLAAAPPPPEQVRILTQDPDNGTTLTWRAGAGAPADTRYEILWRAAHAPLWERVAHTGITSPPSAGPSGAAEYKARIEISKDNVIFGVRAVDPAGHRSPAVVPFPQR